MTEVMDYMRINLNTELMQNDLEVEDELEKGLNGKFAIIRSTARRCIFLGKITYLRIFELMELDGYIEYNPGLAYLN